MIQFNKKEEKVYVKLEGNFTLRNSEKLMRRLFENICSDTEFILDLSKVNFMDSAGLGAIVAFYKKLKINKSDLIIHSLNDDLKILFEITRATKFFKVVEHENNLKMAGKIL